MPRSLTPFVNPNGWLRAKFRRAELWFSLVPSDSYKTFYMLRLALKVSQRGEVIYVYPEGVFDVGQRIEALLDYTGLDGSRLILCPDAVEMINPASVTQFIASVRQRYKDAVMFVIDTLAANFGDGDENSARDMGRYNHGINRIEKAFRCPVATVHHSGRKGKNERGSTALKGNADVMVRISKSDGGITVECTKMRPAKKFPSEHWKVIPHLHSCVLEKHGEVDPRLLQIMKALAQADMRHGEIRRLTNIPASTLTRLLAKLKSEKYISEKDEYYHLLKKGHEALAEQVERVGHPSIVPTEGTTAAFHSVERDAASANGNTKNEIVEVLCHVPPID